MTASTGTTAAWPRERAGQRTVAWPRERAGRLPVAWAVLAVAAALATGAALVLAAGLRVQDAVLGGRWRPGWLGGAACWVLAGGACCAGGCLLWDRLLRRRGRPDRHPLELAGAAWSVTAASGALVWLVVSL